jgi:uncharacterized protein (TIGR02284 family)
MANTEILNDLIRINNDRVEGYSKAAAQANDQDLQSLFSQFVQQSRQYANELRGLANIRYGSDDNDKQVTDETTASGKIYRTWMDVKDKFAGGSRKSVLSSCEFGEDAAQRAYEAALKDDDLSPDVRSIIERQKSELLNAHDQVKRMRDMAAAEQ